MALRPLRIELRLHAGAVTLEGAFGTGRIGALEDPVLPGRQASEDLGLHRLRAGEAQVRLEPREAVGGERGALLEEDAHLVGPVDMIERRRDESEAVAVLGRQRLADLGLGHLYARGLAQ